MAQYEHVPCHVVDARYLGDYKVWLEFNDPSSKRWSIPAD